MSGLKSAVDRLKKQYVHYYDRKTKGLTFLIQDYAIDCYFRNSEACVVAFAPKTKSYRRPVHERPGWGTTFLAKRGVSAIHVKSGEACWYRKPQLEQFFQDACASGLFDRFQKVMTYGGSMGGFGALSFAGLTKSKAVLSINPQVNLGPSVRDWETRFKSAMKQNWDDHLCEIDEQIQNVELPVVVYDRYHFEDRKQVDLVKSDHLVRLNVPFLGHQMPAHLLEMRVLNDLFSQCLAGELDRHSFYAGIRSRRNLLRYRNTLLAKARDNEHRLRVIQHCLTESDLLGIA